MYNLFLSPFDSNCENTTHDLVRFEELHAEKRELESEIENKIAEIDQIAMEEFKSAEENLRETNLKCATIFARLERVAGGALFIIFCV